jgi:hypothetical protein
MHRKSFVQIVRTTYIRFPLWILYLINPKHIRGPNFVFSELWDMYNLLAPLIDEWGGEMKGPDDDLDVSDCATVISS